MIFNNLGETTVNKWYFLKIKISTFLNVKIHVISPALPSFQTLLHSEGQSAGSAQTNITSGHQSSEQSALC